MARTPQPKQDKPIRADGLAARRLACAVIEDVTKRRQALDDRMDKLSGDAHYQALQPSDRGLVRAISTAAMRRHGMIRKVLSVRLSTGMPPRSGRLESILIGACAQILVLETAPHAAVDTAITLAREDAHARHFTDLANAVLRRVATEKATILAEADPLRIDTPPWLADRWVRAYGAETAGLVAAAHMHEPSVDISVKSDPEGWADQLGGIVLPTGSVRLTARTAIPQLPGFSDGEWWVQDAAAAIPATLLQAGPGQRILDLCAAPGGKTAQLALTGADVVAVDRSPQRMARLSENMARLKFTVESAICKASAYATDVPFDGILLDAPCSATGTIRRHPDVAWLKTMEDLFKLVSLQTRLLDHAATLLKPGGTLVYATCSLEPEEGEQQISRFLERHPQFQRLAVMADEVGGDGQMVTPQGDLRCLPCYWPHDVDRLAGMDGFFAARLVRHML
jgi:16S rRNA (cytosine967-C5)-methyltransferase